MNAMLHIRVNVFRVSQYEMARIAQVSQPTVSKWESGLHVPLSTALKNIRQEAKKRRVRWDDAWFWENA
jgi:DNA-binding transcriptional regulator YiaG